LELAEFSPEQVDQILNHENAHANVAEQVQSQKFNGYRILFTKDKDGELLVQPFAKLSTDYSFSDEQILEDRMKVIEAPLQYGDRLSPDDKEKIQKLQKSLLKTTSSEDVQDREQKNPDMAHKANTPYRPTETKPLATKKNNDAGFFSGLMNFWRNLFKNQQ
jgi:hypothetical protein